MAFSQVLRSTSQLKLDSQNVRLSSENPSQKEILLEMWENDDIEVMIRDIAEKTYLIHERILIAKEGETFVVIEGNRRTAACKLIIDPQKLGPQIGKRINQILSVNKHFDPSSVKKLECALADTREEIYPIMMTKHLGRSILPWSEWRTSLFIVKVLHEANNDYDEAAEELKIKKSDVVEAVKMTQMHALTKAVADEETGKHFENRKKFRPSTFARIYDSSFVKEKLKFAFNKNGEFLCKTDQTEFAKAWSKVSSALANDDLNSRNFNNLESQKKWWNENFPTELTPSTELPRAVKLGSFDGIKDRIAQKGGGGEVKAAAKKAAKKSRKSPTKLIPPSFPEFEDFDVRVSALIGELKGVNYIQFPNVAALGLRCLWDLSLAAYFERKGRHGKFVNFAIAEAKAKPKNAGKNIDSSSFKSPDSSQYVGAIIKNPTLFDLNDQFGKSLATHKANNVFVSLNQMVHNTKYAADPQEIQSIWTKLDLLIRRLASGEEQSK